MTEQFTLMSWNVERPGSGRIDAVVEAIVSRRPDVLTLQEANDALVERLAEAGYRHRVYGRESSYPTGVRDYETKHGVLIASAYELTPNIAWTGAACYPSLLARASVETPLGAVDVVTAHIPNGASNGWRKAQHCQVLGRTLRDAAPAARILTGDFNEPREFLPDGRVISFGAEIRDPGWLELEGEVHKGTEGLPGPHTWREWDRAVCDLFQPGFHGLTHVIARAGDAMRPMPVTYRTQRSNRFFDHAFVSRELDVEYEYLHALRRDEVSDHSALVLKIGPRPVEDVPSWRGDP